MIRSPRLRQSAKGESCTWPGCDVEDGTIVAAHSNMSIHGRGGNLKSDDIYIAYLCGTHHYEYDYGKDLSREEKEWHFMRAMSVTLGRLVEKGLLKVA